MAADSSFAYHFIDSVSSQSIIETGDETTKIGSRNETFAVLVKDVEGPSKKYLFGDGILLWKWKPHCQKLGEFNRYVP